jgi:hypothetical protein
MKRLLFSLSLVALLTCSAKGQEPDPFKLGPIDNAPAPAVNDAAEKGHTLTPDMYRYLIDLQRYGGPVNVTQQRAMIEADQRKQRLAAMKWYGYSNSRPVAGATPFMGTYGPHWVGNSWRNDFHWRDFGHHQTIIMSSRDGGTQR